ncbi:hypothetical protein GCM10027422_43670 [Hymenobacter arcticus]
MATFDVDALLAQIDAVVHPQGGPPKTTGPALNGLLRTLTTSLAEAASVDEEQRQTPYLFQVGAEPNDGLVPIAFHVAKLSVAQARYLVETPGATVALVSDEVAGHQHTVTVAFDPDNHTFVVVAVTAPDGTPEPDHAAWLIGGAAPAAAATFGGLQGAPADNAALAAALAAKADSTDPRLTGLDQLVNSLAVRIGSDAARTRTYYAGVGTQAAKNADDGLVRALAAAQPGDTVQVTTPIRMPFADPYAAVLLVRPGITLDMAGFDISSVLSQDGLGFGAGTYTVRGGDATIYSNGQGSCGLTWPDGANPTVRAYDLHLVNRGSASAALMRSGSLWQRGSVEVDSRYNATGVNLMTNNARYELVGDLTVRTGSAGLEVGGGGQALLRQGRCLVATAGAMLARVYDGGQLELAQCVLDVAAGPTTGGARLGGGGATLILTSVTVIGGSPVGVATGPGHLILRGSTTLPAAYDVAYLRSLGLTVTDERPAAGAGAATPAPAAVLEFVFEAGFADSIGRTLGARQAGTYASEQRQNVASVSYQVAGQPVGLPLTLAAADVLQVAITRADTAQPAVLTLLS